MTIIDDFDPPLRVERDARGVVTLVLQRPARRNALGKALVAALGEAVAALSVDATARAVVITGAGEAFCAGADLKERAQMPQAEVDAFVGALRGLMDAVAALPQPTVAAINGAALGGGCELALACDLRVMAEGAQIGLPEVQLGIIPGAGGTQRLARLLGPARAKALIFTARRLTAEEAAREGLVHAASPPGGLAEAVEALIEPILRAAPIALTQAKRAIDEGLELPLPEGLLREQAAYAVTIPTEDRLEALAAFREKRAPRFQGR
jgi:methylglutaconyl-CoA hydratase